MERKLKRRLLRGSIENKPTIRQIMAMLVLFISVWSRVYAQAPETYQWGNVAIGGGGFVSGIITSKKESGLLYARTDVGGAYRWDNATNSWIPLLDWVSENELGYQGVESLAIDPNAPNKLYMLVGTSYFNNGKTAILRSADYGATFSITDVTNQFKAHGNGMGRQSGEKLVIDPKNTSILYCGTRWNGVFKSMDGGVTWARLTALNVTTTPNENGISFVVLNNAINADTETQTLFAGISLSGTTNLYRSDDAGQSFTAVVGAPTTLMPQRAVLSTNGDLYITYGNGAGPSGHWALPEPMDTGQIWKYAIGSGTWTNITPSGYTRAFSGISVDPNNANRIIASTVNAYFLQYNNAYGDRIFISTNGGANWTDVVQRGFNVDTNGSAWLSGAIHWAGSIEFDPFDTKKVWITSGNGIFRTDNIDATRNVWKFQVKGLEETVPYDLISISNGPVMSVVLDYDGFRHSAPDVQQYAPAFTPSMGSTRGLAYAALNPNVVLRAGSKMYQSADVGMTWKECTAKGKDGYIAVSADGKVFLHCPAGSAVTYRSTDKGASWTAVSGLGVADARFAADPANPAKFYVYDPNAGVMLVSTNAGVSFTAAGTLNTGGSKIILSVPGYEGHLWVALGNNGLMRSINTGQSFVKISGVTACNAVGLGKEATGKSYPTVFIWGTVGGVRGLFRSIDEGATWVRVNDDDHEYGGLANGQFVTGDMNVFGRVYMSTAGRGIVYGESSQACIPTFITPHIKVNNGTSPAVTLADVLPGSTVILEPGPTVSGSWAWSGPNGFTATSGSVILSDIQTSQSGIYNATYTNVHGCESGAQTFMINVDANASPDVTTGIDEMQTSTAIVIYPNPAGKGDFSVAMAKVTDMVSIVIYTLEGTLVYSTTLHDKNGLVEVKAGLRPGVYVIHFNGEKFKTMQKLIVN